MSLHFWSVQPVEPEQGFTLNFYFDDGNFQNITFKEGVETQHCQKITMMVSAMSCDQVSNNDKMCLIKETEKVSLSASYNFKALSFSSIKTLMTILAKLKEVTIY